MRRRTSWFLVLLWCAALCSDFLHAQIPSTDEAAAAKPFDNDELLATLQAISKNELDDCKIAEVVPRLVVSYEQEATRSSMSLDALWLLHKRNPKSVEPSLDRFAPVIEQVQRDRELYDVCNLFLRIDYAPAEVVDAITKKFDFEKEQDFFATARGAALLVRFSSDTDAARIWLETQMTRSRDFERVTVTDALSYGGIAAKPSLPKIKKLLEDESHAVRSAAAWAVWQIDRDADIAVPALLASLDVEGELYITHRISPSSWNPDHRIFAVHRLGDIDVQQSKIAHKIVRYLNDDDELIHFATLRALAKLGVRSPEIIDAVRKKCDPKESEWSHEASKVLRQLMEKPADDDC